ncbi:MAG: hypothetical protein K2J11_04880 [Oscillospiraceae bacterium]|nr:hypothetical protein [Oscillospiraceae bacterium]
MIYATNCRDSQAAKPPTQKSSPAFQGCEFPKGRALWSRSAEREILSCARRRKASKTEQEVRNGESRFEEGRTRPPLLVVVRN